MSSLDQARALLQGSYDLHIHPIPSHVPRTGRLSVLAQAEEAGMAGVLLKNHYEPTGARAILANRRGEGFRAKAYGAAVLNWPLGGLNPYAVHSALKIGAHAIFMPTRDAANCLFHGDMPGDFPAGGHQPTGYAGESAPGNLRDLRSRRSYRALLATGHISPLESVLLCREGRRMGVRMVLTRPEWDRPPMDADTQAELAQLGVYVEKCWYNIAEGNCTAESMASHIRTVGPKHCFLSHGRGRSGRETPAEGMARFVQVLIKHGICAENVTQMLRITPEDMLNR
ncbi:MAG: DUF6282 family protein [Eubacteriales bacterium]